VGFTRYNRPKIKRRPLNQERGRPGVYPHRNLTVELQ
jgi:hypothetical protein